jgi:predicted O-linked N-acetylglucosamine transferase (SPINDLY family)
MNPSDKLRDGITALNHRKWSDAEKLFNSVLKVQPNHIAALNLMTVTLMKMERFAEAERFVSTAIRLHAHSDVSFYNYGLILKRLNKPELALRQFDQALRLNPGVAETWNNRGTALSDLKRYQDAIFDFDKALKLQPNYAEALCNKAKAFINLKRFDEASATYDKALEISPDLAAAWLGRGDVQFQLHHYREAFTAYDKALAIDAALPEAWLGCGNASAELKRYEDAFIAYDKALALKPGSAKVWLGRGNAFFHLKRCDEALLAYDKASAIEPELAAAWLGRGNVLLELGRYNDAGRAYERALTFDSNFAEAFVGLGNVFNAFKRYNDALVTYDKALALKPDFAEAWHARGNIFVALQQYDRAFAAYDNAVKLKADLDYSAGLRLYAKLQLCDWADLETETAQFLAKMRAGEELGDPFSLLAMPSSPGDQLQCATRRSKSRPTFPPLWRGEAYSHDRIRVAYLSSEFREHAVGYLAVGLFEHHDKSRFEVTAISFERGQDSEFCRRIRAAFEHFIDVGDQSDQEIASFVRQLEVDIAVDLNGFTRNARLGVLACRPSPIQVNYLGYAGTMGSAYYDYIIADQTVVPREQFKFYSEKIAWLPHSFLVNDAARPIALRTPTPSELGLPDEAFVFCCFNQPFKISPAIFDVWMRLLRDVEDSVLWLKDYGSAVTHNLRREAERSGVGPERLIFAPSVPGQPQHLARHRQADLFLDTLYYNAHTTASDALWAGLPVVTCLGSTFAGRVGASLLHAAGLSELVTSSLEDYETLALRLARDPRLLASIKVKLEHNRDKCPLFSSRLSAEHIEAAYTKMYQNHLSGHSPKNFAIRAEADPS